MWEIIFSDIEKKKGVSHKEAVMHFFLAKKRKESRKSMRLLLNYLHLAHEMHQQLAIINEW